VKDKNIRGRLAVHLEKVLDGYHLTNGRLLGITPDNASSSYLMTCELQSTREDCAIEWPALRIHQPCMAHIIQLALSALRSSLGVKVLTKSWEAQTCDQQFGDNQSMDIGKCQRLRKQGTSTRIKCRP
jgi:hypothetical protein